MISATDALVANKFTETNLTNRNKNVAITEKAVAEEKKP